MITARGCTIVFKDPILDKKGRKHANKKEAELRDLIDLANEINVGLEWYESLSDEQRQLIRAPEDHADLTPYQLWKIYGQSQSE